MWRVAPGDMGLGALICETERGRPLGMSTERLPRDLCDEDDLCESREWREELLEEEEEEEEDLEDLCLGTSRMFRARPVVGSTVDSSLGLCETW